MRVRKLDANGDMVFGGGQTAFYVDQPEAVAQIVLTRLKLSRGDWFLDIKDGTDWAGEVIGHRTEDSRDLEISNRISTTLGVQTVKSFSSTFVPETRVYSVATTIDTIYGTTTVQGEV